MLFRIISSDTNISARWETALLREKWAVSRHESYQAWSPAAGCRPELHLVEVSVLRREGPGNLTSARQRKVPFSLILFGDPLGVSNSTISSLLEAGADDFIPKNIDERVLVAKIKAHLRRLLPAIAEAASRCRSGCGDLEVDVSRRAVKMKAGRGKFTELSNFTQKELEILAFLVGHEKQVISREMMLERLWGEESVNVYGECVDKHIESIRRKLGLYGKRIRTVYGSGYMFQGKQDKA